MKLLMDGLKAFLVHMGIYLCGRDVGMPEHFLDIPDISAVL